MKNKKQILVAVLGILGIILTTAGVTYAFFSYSKAGTKENSISSGSITFLYTEESQGISLTDAMPMTDVQGKAQANYFDFRVTSTKGTDMDIPYTVTAKIDSNSTLPSEYVKVYLTDQSNNEIESPKVLSTLETYTNNPAASTGEKIIYEGIVPRASTSYNKLFRLRMWLADSINMNSNNDGTGTYNGDTFSIKVNVYAEGATRTQSEAEQRANTNIETLTVNNSDATQVDDTHFTSYVQIEEGTTEATVPIVVDTENDNSTVTIEEVDSLGAVIKDTGVKKIAVTKNVTVGIGTHYFKITVRPEDKSEPTIYYLTVTVSDQPLYSFATDSWATIQANVQAGNLTQYNQDMANGVTRPITLTGDSVTHYLRIANTSSCASALQTNPNLTSTTACGFVIEFADIISKQQMNTTNTNIGGYPASAMYSYVTSTVYNALPIDLRNVMLDTTVVSSHGSGSDATCTQSDTRDSDCNYITPNQKIYLLDRQEVFGDNSTYNTAAGKTRQLDYYIGKQNSDRSKVIRMGVSDTLGNEDIWWFRSATFDDDMRFFGVFSINGNVYDYRADNKYGVSPAFRIG